MLLNLTEKNLSQVEIGQIKWSVHKTFRTFMTILITKITMVAFSSNQ
jgi:hypothetical protein